MDKMIERYLNRGWGLTPVEVPESGNKNSGKKPFLSAWPQNPVRDMETARTYWDNDKNYNVGVMTGEVSNLVVLDIDEPGMFEKFLEQFPECRNTYIVRRNNVEEWRCHYYFKLDGFIPPSHSIKTTGWGDLMSNGKQVVAPPSVHYSGGIYEAVNDVDPMPFKREYYDALLMGKQKADKKKPVRGEETSTPSPKGGIPEGTRNNRLFAFVQKLRDDGETQEEAEAAALDFCQKCEPPYDEQEALRTVASVFSHNITSKRKRTLVRLNYKRESSENDEGELQYKLKPLPFNEVSDKVADLLHEKVATVAGELVILPSIPEEEAIPLKTPADLFSYLGNIFKDVPDWSKGKNFMTKDELFSSIKVLSPAMAGIEKVPHYPPIKGAHYVLPELPPPDMEILREFLRFFSPETKYDWFLILALFMTALWGGPAGQRAPFLITSKDGRGVGKSTLGETVAKLLNQIPIQASTRLKSDDLITRLLSLEARKSRIVIFDNEVCTNQKITNAGMASLFTTSQISGHKLFVGEASRPNYLVWIMTLNSATLDSDFASRCIPIALSKPQDSVNWQERLNTFLEKNRWILIATMLDLLKQDTEYVIPKTRWGLWENQVLYKIPNIDKQAVLNLTVNRQKNNDNDLDKKEMIIDVLLDAINERKMDVKTYRFFISNPEMANLVRDALHLNGGNSWILRQVQDIIAKGDYPALKTHRASHARGFIWDETTSGDGKIINLDYYNYRNGHSSAC